MTQAERRLWSLLRLRRINGFKFRRQQIIGPYIVDFYCPDAKLIVEADGSQHGNEEQAWYDYRRTKWLEQRGYRVLRFWNEVVLHNPVQVAGAIAEALAQAPHPSRSRATPSPSRGEGQGD